MEEVENVRPCENEVLKADFHKLFTIEEKLEFWRVKLRTEYIFFLLGSSYKDKAAPQVLSKEYEGFRCFEIIPEDEEEIEDYNKAILEEYAVEIDRKSSKKALVSLEELKGEFTSRTEGTKDQKRFIASEIDKVKFKVVQLSEVQNSFPFDEGGDFFRHAYDLMYFNGEPYNYSQSIHEYRHLIAINNGQVYAEYQIFLEEELTNVGKKREQVNQVKALSVSQQVLVLYYLGYFSNVSWHDKTKLSTTVASMINKSVQNTREVLTNFDKLRFSKITEEKIKIRKDLIAVKEHLKEIGKRKEMKFVEADLEKLGL